jgi:hypothetical protein
MLLFDNYIVVECLEVAHGGIAFSTVSSGRSSLPASLWNRCATQPKTVAGRLVVCCRPSKRAAKRSRPNLPERNRNARRRHDVWPVGPLVQATAVPQRAHSYELAASAAPRRYLG